jgi:ribonuclease VapC
MIVDTSALVAVVLQQPGYEAVLTKLTAPSAVIGIGTPTVAELGIVLSARLRTDARVHVAELLDRLDIAEVPFGEAHWREAVDAYWRFGRGRHAAALNFGDCLTYAVARLANEPLLFVGKDFAATDLDAA